MVLIFHEALKYMIQICYNILHFFFFFLQYKWSIGHWLCINTIKTEHPQWSQNNPFRQYAHMKNRSVSGFGHIFILHQQRVNIPWNDDIKQSKNLYHKTPKNLDTQNSCCNYHKVVICSSSLLLLVPREDLFLAFPGDLHIFLVLVPSL